ncbi:MAG: pantoate--beta-alanine ligase [Idiomarina sp.]|nr:pantoate--beta-alanine ligase [Idiomarina sp.]
MHHLNSVAELRSLREAWRANGQTIAFVPTMGNLHAGHLSLVEHAKQLADRVIVSIFVNPMQFGANEDLDNYPRTLAADQAALISAGADALFTPTVSDVYPRGLDAQTVVEVPGISDILCGASRPGHFQGVATVVCKLFNMVQPEHAVFGQKDYQQLMVIRLMANDLSMPISIHGVPTAREASGLALSSRNGYLSEAQRAAATAIYASLQSIAEGLRNGMPQDALIASALAGWQDVGLTPDYLSIRRQADLGIPSEQDTHLVILAAAFAGTTRLIDNLEVNFTEVD